MISAVDLLQTGGALAAIVGVPFLWWQLDRARRDSRSAAVNAILERVMSHNHHVLADPLKRSVVEQLEKLGIPQDQREAYWAARAVHLSVHPRPTP